MKVQGGIQQDVELFIAKILNNISLESEAMSNSPQKDQNHDGNDLNDLASQKQIGTCSKTQNKTEYSKRLRDRRNKKLIEAHY